ncbi:MAG: MarR family transcriptional regulator [Methylobacterium sp.]|nr:MarR family transcriptional regulator [Methylobacterium sp.]MCE2932265.1 MarR family transcriptional regulator [Hyphomicrobiales bacterium]MCA3636970.1 MarR family transcriptional regulator [Methylobacterium sp.]MCA3637377.1 MarR family transcriptional regulator [Methylobacterium sp.]MCA3641929.1 MarR family transcriptional regulator [Methylobacterium sp.]
MLHRSLTYHLATISEDGIGHAGRIFETRFGWSVREIRVLRLIRSNPGITFTELARQTKFERSLTSRILAKLMKAGLVARTNSTKDARVFTLTATKPGLALCDQADPLSIELEAMMLEPLTEEQRAAFLEMIDTVRRWVQTGYREKVAARFPEAVAGKAPKRAVKIVAK